MNNWYKISQIESWTPEEKEFLIDKANSIEERRDNLIRRRVRYTLTNKLYNLDVQESQSVATQLETMWQDKSWNITIEKFEPNYYAISGSNIKPTEVDSFDKIKNIIKSNS